MRQFMDEYWMFAEAMLLRASEILGVDTLNHLAAGLGHPFAAALLLSCAGFIAALVFLSLRRPGWGLVGLAVGEELSALSLATAALVNGFALDSTIALVRVVAVVLAVCLISALLRKTLRPSPETVPAAP